MVIDGAANQAKPTAFDLVNRRSPVALSELSLAGGEDADNAPGLKRGRQGVRKHYRLLLFEGVNR